MGFDVVYLPPIHPIGVTDRKGPNNTLDPGPDDPGSPWAIGSAEGGHTAIAPELGTLDDFRRFVSEARDVGLEVALDYALQCSPDHPWVSEHPEWFHHRPDGTIRYAENPPKKYQDIYPINFWPERDADRAALWKACRDVLRYWIDQGVRVFRVDNPHTKPMAFWAWLIERIQRDHPDVIFLSEAFTRPKVMAKLAEVGFTQSYTYFTWRTAAWELREYVDEVAHGPTADYMRPNFWPNTPDILSGPLRDGPPAAFLLRFVLAATLVPSYGIYSGYELFENEPASDANEEYLHSEKYQLRARDWGGADSMAPFIATVNGIRRRHPAFRSLRNVRFHGSSNEQFLVWTRGHVRDGDLVLVVVNLDPHNATGDGARPRPRRRRPAVAGPVAGHRRADRRHLRVGGATARTCGSTPRPARSRTSSRSGPDRFRGRGHVGSSSAAAPPRAQRGCFPLMAPSAPGRSGHGFA